jgi:predicted dehydrogenase
MSAGGRFALTDNGETPDTQDAIFEFDGWTATWSLRECARGESGGYPLEFFGTKGSLGITRSGFKITGDPDIAPGNQIPVFAGAHPVGGPQPVKEPGPRKTKIESIEDRSGDGRAQLRDHVRDFLDCVKSRKQPKSDLESAHRVSTACHLANLSLRLGRKLRWDATKESIVGDADAEKSLSRPYRSPWDKELRTLGLG